MEEADVLRAPAADVDVKPEPSRSRVAATLVGLGQRGAPLAFVAAAAALILFGRHLLLVGGQALAGLLCMGAGAGAFLLARTLVRSPAAWRRWWLLPIGLACAAAAHALAGDGPLMERPLLAPLAWLLGIGLVTAALWRRDAVAEATGPAWSRAELAGVGALFVAALLLRLVGNDGTPAALTGDEGSIALAAAEVGAGQLNNPFTVSWFSFPSLFFMLPGLTIGVFGHSYGALRAPSALAGALTVVALYLWARPMFGRLAAASAAVVLAALNFHVHFSRLGLNNIWDGLFVVLVPAAFWRAWQGGRRRDYMLAGGLLGLSQYFYTGARLLPLVLLGWCALVVLVGEWRTLWRRLPDLGSLAAVALAVFLPLGLFFLRHPEEFSAPTTRVSLLVDQLGNPAESWLAKTSAETGKPAWLLLAENYRDALLGFVSLPLRHWYVTGEPMLLAAPAALFVIGLALALAGIRDKRYWAPLLLLAGTVSVGALSDSTPASQRYVIGAPTAALLVGVGLAALCRLVADVVAPRRRGQVAAALALVAALGIAAADLRFYFFDYAPRDGHGDTNTQVATRLARLLSAYPAGGQVYTFTAPRLVYSGFSTLPFLAPQVTSIEVLDPITEPPSWPLPGPRAAFVFLPERAGEAALVKQRYPGGSERWLYDTDAELLFLLYEVDGPRP
jgi:4-amino-4-deoxy-L-arabinose transferase-like glycosyltransferase